eukprot:SAG22_NODE_6668_length_825_cov_1.125344_2_plen_39_part_01
MIRKNPAYRPEWNPIPGTVMLKERHIQRQLTCWLCTRL